jgi:hypothetical protein
MDTKITRRIVLMSELPPPLILWRVRRLYETGFGLSTGFIWFSNTLILILHLQITIALTPVFSVTLFGNGGRSPAFGLTSFKAGNQYD